MPVGQVVASIPRQGPYSASVVSLLTLIGWQKSAVKTGIIPVPHYKAIAAGAVDVATGGAKTFLKEP